MNAKPPPGETGKIPLGISRCLLGEAVRYNAGHKLSRYCRDYLSRWFHFLDFCPEVQIGMGVPREPVRLVQGDVSMEVRPVSGGDRDYRPALAQLAEGSGAQLDELCGFIFMQKSPSCGLFRVRIYNPNGELQPARGRGAFAEAVTKRYPCMPVEEAGRLTDPRLRENFITRIFVYSDWRQLVKNGLTTRAIVDFHARHKYLLLAHSQRHYRVAGRLLARAGSYLPDKLGARYIHLLMAGLSRIAGRGGHANALQHMQGYLKKGLGAAERSELADLIAAYRRGEVPLVAPLILLKHHARLANDYYRAQVYLEPYPDERGLGNGI